MGTIVENILKKRRGFMILIVDDEIFALELIKRKMVNSGLEIITCSSVKDAKELIIQMKDIKVVVTDLHMADENGFELLRWLENQYPNIKKVIMTAHDYEGKYSEMLGVEIHGMLKKPVDTETEFIPLLKEIMR